MPITERALYRVGRMLSDLEQPVRVDQAIRVGISTAAIDALIQNGLTPEEVSVIVVQSNPDVNHKEDGRLDSRQSTAWFRTASVLALTFEVFGNEKKGLKWLRRPRSRFDWLSALDLMKTDAGAELVEQTLLQIDSGYFG